MNPSIVLGIIGSTVILVVLFEMLRRRHLREKYAVVWFLVALASMTVTIFPDLLNVSARAVGVEVPVNLLFFAASMILLVLALQHSYELGRLEEKSRTLAEEVALLRLELDQRLSPPSEPEHPGGSATSPEDGR
ncbi:MAG: hypothetical protein JWO11_3068 [Nocardioides sp.]|nr:hypothetical protein [Nocardioides sp.]